MCDIATGLMGASAVIGAAGALKSGTAAKNQADSEAALYRSQQAARLQKAEFDVETARRKYEYGRSSRRRHWHRLRKLLRHPRR